ncbi:MAG: rhodanese-like domain-containing protein, partial [Bacteroidota bacterium]
AHGAGSACGKNLSKDTWGYLGDQKATNYALRTDMTKEEFIAEVTAGLTPPPQYFAKNAMLNKSGYGAFEDILEKGSIARTPAQFEELAEQHEALVLDTRTADEFAAAHVPNSIFIGIDGSFAPWVGALITDINQPILLVTPTGREEEVVTRLARVGYDNTLGYLAGGVAAWNSAGKETDRIQSMTADELAVAMHKGLDGEVLDVRRPTEFLAQHLHGATNYPLDYINRNMNRLDRTQTYYIHCRSGYRSMVAASILRARGFQNLADIAGGWIALEKTNAPQTDYVCPTSMTQEVIDEAVAAVV